MTSALIDEAQRIEAEHAPGTDHGCDRQDHRRPVIIGKGLSRAVGAAADQDRAGAQLQQQAESLCQPALLTQTQPENRRAFHGPRTRRPLRTQAQRDRQRGKHHAQRQAGFHQQDGLAWCTCSQPACQPHVDQAERKRAERSAEFQMLDQRILQAEPDYRRAKQQRAVDVIALARSPAQQGFASVVRRRAVQIQQFAAGKQQADRQIHQEEHNQKGLGAPEQGGCVGLEAPGKADAEGAEEADQVENAPGLEPGDGDDARIEQGKVTEQRDMAALSGRGQQRRREAAQRSGAGECQ
jgi:hypothetical protein